MYIFIVGRTMEDELMTTLKANGVNPQVLTMHMIRLMSDCTIGFHVVSSTFDRSQLHVDLC